MATGKKYNILSCLIALMALFYQVNAQEYRVENFSTEHGLPQASVLSIEEDTLGRLWLGTWGGGLCIYDGYSFEKIDSLPNMGYESVHELYRDSKGRMWVGTLGSVWVYDGKTFESINEKYKLSLSFISHISEGPAGEMIVVGKEQLVVISSSGAQEIPLPNGIEAKQTAIYKGELLVGTTEGVYVLKDGKLDIFRPMFGQFALTVSTMAARNDTIWMGAGERIYQFDGKNVRSVSRKLGISPRKIFDIKMLDNGENLVSTFEGVYSIRNGQVRLLLDESNGLIHGRVFDAEYDRQGNLWCGTYQGLGRYSGQKFMYYSDRSGLSSLSVYSSFLDSRGRLWVGNTNGTVNLILKNGDIKTFSFPVVKNVQQIGEDSDGTIWIAVNKMGLLRVTGIGEYQLSYDLFDRNFGLHKNTIYGFDIRGMDIYVWGDDGFCIFDKRIDEFRHYGRGQGLFTAKCYTGWVDKKGDVWLCAWGPGLLKIEREGRRIKKVIKLAEQYPEMGFQPEVVREDEEGNIYVGTNGQGFWILKPDGSHVVLHDKNGLMSDLTFAHHIDKDGFHWVGTEKGMQYFRLSDEGKITDTKIYTYKEGFIGNELFHKGIHEGRDGRMYFSTIKNLTAFDKTKDINSPVEASLYLSCVMLYNKKVDWGKKGFQLSAWEGVPVSPDLGYKQNHLTFKFNGISLGNVSGVKYKWILEGFDEEWMEPSINRSAVYSNLPPGDYTFKVIATNSDGIWNSKELSYSFSIATPFYAQWWFLVLVVLVGSFLIAGGFYIRTHALKKKNRILEYKVERRTRELREEKEQVEYQQELLADQNQEILEKSELILDSINYAKRIQDAILPDLEELSQYFENPLVYYRPKDVVSGDYYWFYRLQNKLIIAAVDCTGHGVPGAFMSIITFHLLDQFVQNKEVQKPSELLNWINQQLPHKIQGTEEVDSSTVLHDGMDIALCMIDIETWEMQYSGAHNSAFIFRGEEMITLPADKIHIGMSLRYQQKKFTNHVLQLKPSDKVYIFSDGYADQVGGPRRKRYRLRPFTELLGQIKDKTPQEQEEILEKTFNEHRGEIDQMDDILIMGIQIPKQS